MQAILRTVATVKNQVVAQAIGVDDSTITRITSGESGVKLDRLQPFLACLGLKVVPWGHVCIDHDEWEATCVMARKYIESREDKPTIRVDWNS